MDSDNYRHDDPHAPEIGRRYSDMRSKQKTTAKASTVRAFGFGLFVAGVILRLRALQVAMPHSMNSSAAFLMLAGVIIMIIAKYFK
jgi:hypothetical protein